MSEILYRKGAPCCCSAWFNRIEEAINYDGDVVDADIYYLCLGKEEFNLYFRNNGVGIILKENHRSKWASLSSMTKKVPRVLTDRLNL